MKIEEAAQPEPSPKKSSFGGGRGLGGFTQSQRAMYPPTRLPFFEMLRDYQDFDKFSR